MTTTAQALDRFHQMLLKLQEIRSASVASAAPNALESSISLLYLSVVKLPNELTSPHSTWQKLLQEKLPQAILETCSKLVQCGRPSVTAGALKAAAQLCTLAVAGLPLASANSGSKLKSHNKLTQEFRRQLEQSGLLQLLQDLISSSVQQLQAALSAGQVTHTPQLETLWLTASSLLQLVGILSMLLPNFHSLQALAAHPTAQVGLQCVAPTMQLAMISVQYVSQVRGMLSPDQQLGFGVTWLHTLLRAADMVLLPTSDLLLDYASSSSSSSGAGGNGAGDGSSSSSSHCGDGFTGMESNVTGSSSRCDQQSVLVAVAQCEQTAQCLYYSMLVHLLVPVLRDAANMPGSGGSSSSAASSASSQTIPQYPGAATAVDAQLQQSRLHSNLPAAYIGMLEQLGCSQQAAVLQATYLASRTDAAVSSEYINKSKLLLARLTTCGRLTAAQQQLGISHSQLAACQVSFTAVVLQWLLDMPADVLCNSAAHCGEVSRAASLLCQAGLNDLAQQQQQQQQHDSVRDASKPHLLVLSLFPQVLARLLQIGRQHGLRVINTSDANSSNSSSGSLIKARSHHSNSDTRTGHVGNRGGNKSSGSSGSSSSSSHRSTGSSADTLQLLQTLSQVVLTCVYAAGSPAAVALIPELGQPTRRPAVAHLPVPAVQYCTVLQDVLRFSSTVAPSLMAAALQRPGSSVAAPATDWSLADMLACVSAVSTPALPFRTQGGSSARAGPLPENVLADGDIGSTAALELFGLLCSTLKLCSSSSTTTTNTTSSSNASNSNNSSSIPLLGQKGLVTALLAQVHGTGAVLFALSAGFRLATSNPAAQADTQPSSSSGVVGHSRSMLPWLMLLGRCCLATAAHMHVVSATSAVDPGSKDAKVHTHLARNLALLQCQLAAALQWLEVQNAAQQLAAAGFKIHTLQQQLRAAAEALVCHSCSNPELVSVLQSVGIALNNSCPNPHACNNPLCSNMSGPSEAQLVSGRSCICTGCFTAHYCSRACQKAHWNKQHSPVCKAIAAAAAAAGEPADAA